MSFQGKYILITGASSGIGRQIAIDLSNLGANLYLLGRNENKLKETIYRCHSDVEIESLAIDFNCTSAIVSISNLIGKNIDGVVFNAGMVKVQPISYLKEKDISEMFNVNFNINVQLSKLLMRKKKINKGASIVFISSIATKKPTMGNSLYNSTKGAINSFAHSMAIEVARKGIRVNTILPGFIEDTSLLNDSRTNEEKDAHLKSYPLGRFGNTSDISSITCFLLSNNSSWITGTQIPVDGGFSMK